MNASKDQLLLSVLMTVMEPMAEQIINQGVDLATQAVGALRIDSRLLQPDDIFVAFQGGQMDGHNFIDKALQQGAVCIVVEQARAAVDLNGWLESCSKLKKSAVFVVVKDQVALMAQLGLAYRQFYRDIPFIAITGSCGKTTVKNLTQFALQKFEPTLATINSQNNHLGVPMTVSRLTADTRLGVAELGANHAGEIAAGVAIVQPQVAVLTCVNAAHVEGFGSLDKTARAKAEIFAGLTASGVAVLNRDDEYFDFWRGLLGQQVQCISFGESEQADVRLLAGAHLQFNQSMVRFGVPADLIDRSIKFQMPLLGRHNELNGVIAIAAMIGLGHHIRASWRPVFFERLDTLFAGVEPVAGRLVPIPLQHNMTLIDDSYNATPSAVVQALRYLQQQDGEKWFLFGGMGELGTESRDFHEQIGREAALAGVSQFWAYSADGAVSAEAYAKHVPPGNGAKGVKGAIACFTTHEDMNAALLSAIALQPPAILLVKGSRSRKMELVVAHLRSQFEHP